MNADTTFPSTFFDEEIRCDFTITPALKRIWQVQLTLASHLDEICRAHNIPYWMDYGTLLGAVRHKGFIPWDIDMDFSMMRSDYMRFLEVAPSMLPSYYTFQSDFLHYDMVKIRDDRTSAIYFPLMDPAISQGLFIDITPLDDVADGISFKDISEMQHEILLIIHNPNLLLKYIKEKGHSDLPMDFILELLRTDPAEVQHQFDLFCLSHAGKSTMIAVIYEYIQSNERRLRNWYKETVHLPFEGFSFPAPACYDEVLRVEYGDSYMTPIRRETDIEQMIFDADIPYPEYLKGGLHYDPQYWIDLKRITPDEA